MIRVGIVGGAGYVAGELLRILIHHPKTEISFVHSNSQESKPITSVHADLVGDLDTRFASDLNVHPDIDVLFLCGGHGNSATFLQEHQLPGHTKIIDLSSDFRMKSSKHGFVYGLPELNREEIRTTAHLANPGCFATAIQLGLLPLVSARKLNNEVHIHAITGSTGAGAKPSSTTHFSWRNNNISIYKAFRHQHLREIVQSLRQLDPGFAEELNFLPVRGNFTRGIYASL